jgi:predicted nucleic acid-binding protein
MIFVDTSAWFASFIPSDPDHVAAAQWLAANKDTLLTTDFVVDETLTLLRARKETQRSLRAGDQFFQGGLAQLYFLAEDDIRLAWNTFRRNADKEWSFTDCTSKIIMNKLQSTTAFAFDHHFRQFGTTLVVP